MCVLFLRLRIFGGWGCSNLDLISNNIEPLLEKSGLTEVDCSFCNFTLFGEGWGWGGNCNLISNNSETLFEAWGLSELGCSF